MFYKNEIHLNPPDHRLVHAVTFYIAPTAPITNPHQLTRFANSLSDLKPAQRRGADITDFDIDRIPRFSPAEVEFIEDVVKVNISITRVPRILDATLNLPLSDYTRSDAKQSTLRRKILMMVFPHRELAFLAQKYEAADKKELPDDKLVDIRRKIFDTPMPDLNQLIGGENPFLGIVNF